MAWPKKFNWVTAYLSAVALLVSKPAISGLIDPNAPRPQPEPTVVVVPFGDAVADQSSSLGASGLGATGAVAGLVGIAADLAAGSASANKDDEQRKQIGEHVAGSDYQVLFAAKIASGLRNCHMTVTQADKLPAPEKNLNSQPVSGSRYKSHPNHRYLVETRLATVAVQKSLFSTKLCVYGFAKAYKTSDMSQVGVYKGSNGLGNCKNSLDHYSDDDPEKIPELKRVIDAALTVAGNQISEQLCE